MTPVEINAYYRHYKGGLYRIDAIATHSENNKQMVIYTNIEGETWVRPLEMWNERANDQPRFAIVEEQSAAHFEFEKARIK